MSPSICHRRYVTIDMSPYFDMNGYLKWFVGLRLPVNPGDGDTEQGHSLAVKPECFSYLVPHFQVNIRTRSILTTALTHARHSPAQDFQCHIEKVRSASWFAFEDIITDQL
jgi:hypothetical protein